MSTADIMDQLEGQNVAAAGIVPFKRYGGNVEFSGQIATVKCFENNALVRQRLLREPGTGKILVVDGGGSLNCALMGDKLASGAVSNGWNGVIINGAIRDSAQMKHFSIGVIALGTHPKKSSKEDFGFSDIPLSFHGLTFTPGHWVYVDDDGIVLCEKEVLKQH